MGWEKYAPLILVSQLTKKKPTIKGAIFKSEKGNKLMDVKIRHLSGGVYIMYSPESDLRIVKKKIKKSIKDMEVTVKELDKKIDNIQKGEKK